MKKLGLFAALVLVLEGDGQLIRRTDQSRLSVNRNSVTILRWFAHQRSSFHNIGLDLLRRTYRMGNWRSVDLSLSATDKQDRASELACLI